jgi:hypothetical protein
MYVRILVFVAAVLGLTWSAALLAGRAGAQGVPVLTIEQQLANQRALINQLQTRLAADEQRSPGRAVKAATPAIAAPHFVRPKTTLADMGPGLALLQTQHVQFGKLNPAAASSGPDLTTQVAALTKQVGALKAELSVDETVIFGELTLVRNNVNAVDNDTTTVYGDAVMAAWLACVDYGNQIEFAGSTQLSGTPPAPCFAPGY